MPRSGLNHPKQLDHSWGILLSQSADSSNGVDFDSAPILPKVGNPMNPDQLDALRIAKRVILAGSAGTYTADELAKLRRASGLANEYGRECARAVLFDAAAGCGFFAEKRDASRR